MTHLCAKRGNDLQRQSDDRSSSGKARLRKAPAKRGLAARGKDAFFTQRSSGGKPVTKTKVACKQKKGKAKKTQGSGPVLSDPFAILHREPPGL